MTENKPLTEKDFDDIREMYEMKEKAMSAKRLYYSIYNKLCVKYGKMKMSDDTRVLLAQFALEANIIDACFQIDDGDNNTKRGSTSVGFSIDNKSTSLYNQEAAKGGARKGLSTRKQGVSPKPPRKSLK